MVRDTSQREDFPAVSVLGDGQLARMMQQPAIALNIPLRILATDPASSAAQVIPDVVLGDYTELSDVQKAAQGAAVVTFEHEHVPNEISNALLAQGIDVQPRPDALQFAQDKLLMRQKIQELGGPVPEFTALDNLQDLKDFWSLVDEQVCIKARTGGYDGHGVWFPDSLDEAESLLEKLLSNGTALMAERKVALVRELSALLARTPDGKVKSWPIAQSVQQDGICVQATTPVIADEQSLIDQATDLGVTIAQKLKVTGVLAVELFETVDEQGKLSLVVNELAMRPHNTGHWTQDGSRTSQFEQHLRAVMNRPLGDTESTGAAAVMANVLGADHDPKQSVADRMNTIWQRYPEAKIHWYGKQWRAGRKLGHINMILPFSDLENGRIIPTQSQIESVEKNARNAATYLSKGHWQF